MNNPKRLLSVDALRGFDMVLISGGGAFIERLEGVTGIGWVDAIAHQLKHPAWNGFTFYDSEKSTPQQTQCNASRTHTIQLQQLLLVCIF